jgi:hypothetical protein
MQRVYCIFEIKSLKIEENIMLWIEEAIRLLMEGGQLPGT